MMTLSQHPDRKSVSPMRTNTDEITRRADAILHLERVRADRVLSRLQG